MEGPNAPAANLSEENNAQAGDGDQTAVIPAQIAAVDGDLLIPLSFAQQGLWRLLQTKSAGGEYNIPMALRLRGELNEAALSRALNRLVERHETLRTRFVTVQGGVFQRIGRTGCEKFVLKRHDLRGTSDAGDRLSALLVKEMHAPFHLDREWPVRGCLVRMENSDHALLITLHHMCADSGSIAPFARELSVLYSDFLLERPSSLEPITFQYSDYVARQRRGTSDPAITELGAHWREVSERTPAVLELPTDRRCPPEQDFDGDSVHIELNKELTAGLKELSDRLGLKISMTVLAGWALVLSRLSGQQDLVIGTQTTNRTVPGTEGLVGMFVDFVPVRLDLSGNPTGETLLSRTRAALFEAQKSETSLFAKGVERAISTSVLSPPQRVPVMFAWHNGEAIRFEMPGLEVTEIQVPLATVNCGLTLEFTEFSDHVSGTLKYAMALFDVETAERYVGYLWRALAEIIADSQRQMMSIDLPSAEERHQIVVEWNATAVTYPKERSISELFEDQVQRSPEAVAVVCEKGHLSYAELNARTNKLARYLITHGLQSGEYVPIIMDRSLDMLIAQLAVLKSGGAYVPLDPNLPNDRKSFMIRDCGARRILAREAAPPEKSESIQWIDCAKDIVAIDDSVSVTPRLHSRNSFPAYVMYTSGSTGTPKGVIVHQDAVNHLVINNRYVRVGSMDCVVHCSNPAFDASTFEVWSALLNGAKLLIVPQAVVLEAARFAATLREQQANIMFLPVGLFRQHTQTLPGAFSGLQYLLVGGEVLDPTSVMRVLHNGPPQRLLNAYGPTECTTFSTTHTIEALDDNVDTIPIGSPISNAQIYVLDDRMHPVPLGVVGQIYIGGPGVALGYLNRPELTATSFVANPFCQDNSARLYNSGDLGRWRADGTIEYVGRNDQQVKLRGFRVELGEVETQLTRHPKVRGATVMVREDTLGDKRLIAYILKDHDAVPSVEELLAHAKLRLPDYMVPSAFVVLDNFPLTSNGKIDRRALPMPGLGAYATRQYEEPQGEMEEVLAEIWRELLQVERVGREDNFFLLGGNSLLAIRLMSVAAVRFDAKPIGITVFQCPTVRQMAKVFESLLSQRTQSVPLVRRLPSDEIPLGASQRGLWETCKAVNHRGMHGARVAIRISGRLNVEALERSVAELVHRHEALRTRLVTVDGVPRQLIDEFTEFRIEKVDLTAIEPTERDQEVRRLIVQIVSDPVDLAVGPIFVSWLFKLDDSAWIFLVAADHIIADAVSLGTISREIWSMYSQLVRGYPLSLPALPVQFADYAVWERRTRRVRIEGHGPYWAEHLAGAQRARVSADRDATKKARPVFVNRQIAFGIAPSAALRELSRCEQTTLAISSFAIYAALLLRWCDSRDMVISFAVTGRRRPEVEATVGFFAGGLSLRVRLGEDDSFLDLLRRVMEEYTSAFEHGDLADVGADVPQLGDTVTASFMWMPRQMYDGSAECLQWCSNDGSAGAVRVEPFDVGGGANPLDDVDLDMGPLLILDDTDSGVAGSILYRANCFTSEIMEQFGRNLVDFAETLASRPTIPIRSVSCQH